MMETAVVCRVVFNKDVELVEPGSKSESVILQIDSRICNEPKIKYRKSLIKCNCCEENLHHDKICSRCCQLHCLLISHALVCQCGRL